MLVLVGIVTERTQIFICLAQSDRFAVVINALKANYVNNIIDKITILEIEVR